MMSTQHQTQQHQAQQPQEQSNQQMMQSSAQQQQRGGRRARMSPESVSVIICGWPNRMAHSVAESCAKRGFRIVPFGLSEGGEQQQQQQQQMTVPGTQEPMRLVRFSDPNAKSELKKVIDQERSQQGQHQGGGAQASSGQQHGGRFVVVVDTCTDQRTADHVKMFNELQVPFIMQSGPERDVYHQAVREAEGAKSLAMITEYMNKQMSVLDQMWRESARRFPALFDDFDLTFRSSRPDQTPRSLMDSFSDLLNREFGMESIMPFEGQQGRQQMQQSQQMQQGQPVQQGQQQQQAATIGQHRQQQPIMKQMSTMEGHLTREYTFKNGSGSSTFSFQQSVHDEKEFGESVADSVGFLALKSQEMSRPQVYSLLDVAQQPSRMLYLDW